MTRIAGSDPGAERRTCRDSSTGSTNWQFAFGSCVSQVESDGSVKGHRIIGAVDCGPVRWTSASHHLSLVGSTDRQGKKENGAKYFVVRTIDDVAAIAR
jgi:hypothetical protein